MTGDKDSYSPGGGEGEVTGDKDSYVPACC